MPHCLGTCAEKHSWLCLGAWGQECRDGSAMSARGTLWEGGSPDLGHPPHLHLWILKPPGGNSPDKDTQSQGEMLGRKPQPASESAGEAYENRFLASTTRASDSEVCISKGKLACDTDDAGLETLFWKPLLYTNLLGWKVRIIPFLKSGDNHSLLIS